MFIFLYRVYQDWLWYIQLFIIRTKAIKQERKKLATNCQSYGTKDLSRILCPKSWEHSNWSKICRRRRSTWVRAQVKPHQFGTSYTIQWKAHEDASAHLQIFLEIGSTIHINGVDKDVILLRLFPFSLEGKARKWVYIHQDNINNWVNFSNAFLSKFFPIGKTTALRGNIISFQQ